MLRFLFWNLNRQSIASAVASLANEHLIDVIILAECHVPVGEMLLSLNKTPANGVFYYAATIDPDTRTEIFVRHSSSFVQPLHDAPHLSIRRLAFPSYPEFLLAAVHLPSPMHATESDRDKRAGAVIRTIIEREHSAGHSRTIVVGDFNMNPFERGMTAADSFNAVGVRSIAAMQDRTLHGTKHRFFYNPMWSLLGDQEDRAHGTYFYHPKGYESIYWNIFDQVIVRPDLMSAFRQETLRIITKCEGHEISSERSLRPSLSDHFPITFCIDFRS